MGDFNGDGAQDLAVANAFSNNVSVLLGNGLGRFTASAGSPFVVGNDPFSIAVGDFNGDGVADLVTANANSNDITVLLGNGLGGFTAAAGSPFSVGSAPFSVVVGDFDGDGIQDLATANLNSSNITVLLGNSSAGFTAAAGSPFTPGFQSLFLAVGDFNGDGIPDLVAASVYGYLTVLLGNGTGAFSAGVGGPFAGETSQTVSVAVGDFNGDGIQDIATANYSRNSVAVLLGGKTPTSSVLTTSSQLTITLGQSVPLSLAVTNTTGAFNTPTGTATFFDGATDLGTSQASSPYAWNASGLGLGKHMLAATYGGNSRSLGSASNSITIQVFSPCDFQQNGNVNVAEVQVIINEALGITPAVNDLNGDGVVDALDVQIEIIAAVVQGCVLN